ncbi:hypothetical protein RZO55_06770 [Clostridium boliviensis]|uniref:Uncharacterized protein n=1 Tax=Clostridium boliviensis TaxID=318465 RepID=A0ABU4GM20_9CLOT|nr:hypothetical protein [Clostridium boliviensis]MDW2797277.1 hypothetical protein [Clostridium boliviensis]
MKKIILKIIDYLGYVLIFASIIIGTKVSTHATWINVIRSEFWNMIFVLVVIIVAEVIIKIVKDKKRR